MGGVIIDYSSLPVLKHYTDDPALQKKLDAAIFLSYEWCLLDMGAISEEEAIDRMCSHLDTDAERKLARTCFSEWHHYNMWEKPGMKELVSELKEKGYRTYIFSNASIRMLRCFKDVITNWKDFDGIVFSAETGYMKPQKAFFETGFKRFGIRPEESLFIDDFSINVRGARETGMSACCFPDGKPATLRQELGRLLKENNGTDKA